MTCIPCGSNNVVAKLLGIPTDVVDATEHLLHMADRWEPRRVDLGLVNGRYFTFAAGMGLDASVVERVDGNPRLKKRFGPFYFVECAIVTFLRSYVVNPPRLSVEVDGRTVAASRCSCRTPRTTPTSTTGRCRWWRARGLTPAAWRASC